MRIILASKSTYRKYAMDLLGLEYEIIPSQMDEKSIRHRNPRTLVEKLSEAKAISIAHKNKDAIIIASDALVCLNGTILEKPGDEKEAFKMLKNLSNNKFEFITGLVIHNSLSGEKLSAVRSCEIRFRRLLDREIRKYIAKFPAINCAGAFEHHALLFFSEYIKGSYNFRTAIPVSDLIILLRKQGIQV